MPEIKVVRLKDSGYPDVPAMLAQMESWTPEERFMNQFWRMNNLYKIVDKESRVVTFKMKPEQADLYVAHRKHPRHVICKSRQLGFSTLIQLLFLDYAIFNSNENVFIIAQDKDAASHIMETKIKFAYEHLPEEIKQERKVTRTNANEFMFNNNSKITVTVSARSATATRIHSSEMAKSYIKDPEKTHEFWTGTLPSLIPGGTCFIESTAEGAVGDFYEAYNNKAADAPQDPNTFQRHFYSWWHSPEFTSQEEPAGGIDSDSKKYFAELHDKYGIDLRPEQKNWYVAMSRILGFKMKQEYPTVAAEAFEQTSESQVWGRPLAIMEANRRVKNTPYVSNHPAVAVFDIGHSDLAACWCAQYIDDEWRVFGYLEIRKGDIAWFLEKFSYRNWHFKYIVLPHDANNSSFRDKDTSLASQIEGWGYNVIVLPKTENKLRDVYDTGKFLIDCRFNSDPESGVPDGLKRLANYRRKKATDGGYMAEPLHDSGGNCDCADAFRYLHDASNFLKGEIYEQDLDDYLDQREEQKSSNSITGY